MVARARVDEKWSAALIRKMTRLADQKMSAAQIARALGLTRGQVLGKMHRLGIKTKTPPNKRLDAAVVEQLKEMAGQEMSAAQIAEALGLTRGQVLGKLHRLGLKTKIPPSKRLNAAVVEQLKELAGQEMSAARIAEVLGLTRGQVLGKLHRLGLKTNSRTEWPAGAVEKMTELISRGLSNGGIAKALGLTRGQVLGKMRRLGLKTKNAANASTGGSRQQLELFEAAV
jgi:hypothetical protein